MVWSERMKKLFSVGRPLSDVGINNWGFTREQALNILQSLDGTSVSICGGDVLEVVDNKPKHNYENWSCEKKEDESLEGYSKRSVEYARHYISDYEINDKDVLFVLVPQYML